MYSFIQASEPPMQDFINILTENVNFLNFEINYGHRHFKSCIDTKTHDIYKISSNKPRTIDDNRSFGGFS